MIPIEKESADFFDNTGIYEVCVFCKKPTNTWHRKTNNPVCVGCSQSHKVAELVNHMKPKK